MRVEDPLFSSYDFGDALRNAPAKLSEAVDKLTDDELFETDQSALIGRLVTRYMVVVPELKLNQVKPSQREVDIDVSGDPRRFFADRSGPFYVKATEVSFRVPYTGDREVFFCRPSSFSLNPPRADVESDTVVVRVVREDQNPAEYRKIFDQTIAQIQSALARLRLDCDGLEALLQRTAATRIASRRTKRCKDRELLDGLGFGETE